MDTPSISPHIKTMVNDHRRVRRSVAEAVGTFWLVLGGCGSALLAAGPGGIELVGAALAFGSIVLTMAYAPGHVSGDRFDPAATLGLRVSRVAGAIAGAGAALLIAGGGYTLEASFLTEVLLTAAFLIVIVGATGERAPPDFARRLDLRRVPCPVAVGSTRARAVDDSHRTSCVTFRIHEEEHRP